MTVAASDPLAEHAAHWQRLRQRIESALTTALDFGDDCPPRLAEAMRYSVLAPGKRLRPLMALLAAELVGGEVEAALPAACAVEMVHAYSLVHDDLPAMDDDDLRRGRPTCHKQFDEATAILVGDALPPRAFELLANMCPATIAAECCRILAQAAGAENLVGGQADDLIGTNGEASLAQLQKIHRRKTGAMFLAALEMGAVAGGASLRDIERIRAYGEAFGLAFQITDDLLDATGDETKVGKRVGKDAGRGKLTYPQLVGIEATRQHAQRAIAAAREAIAPYGQRAAALDALVLQLAERDK